jgi:hypothetical protein
MNRPGEKVEKLEKKKPYEAPKLLIYGSLAEMTGKIHTTKAHRDCGTGVLKYT